MERTPVLERRLEQAARAGWLYYIGGRTQDEIATTLGVSRQAAQRLVSLAVSEKLIKFRLDHPLAHGLELARRLQERFRLQVCEVTPTDPEAATPVAGLAIAAAEMLESLLASPAPAVFAFSTGLTLKATIAEVAPSGPSPHKLVSIVGSMSRDGRASAYEVVMRLAEKIQAECYPMPTPVVASSVEERHLLQTQRSYRTVKDLAERATATFVGLSEIAPGSPLHRDGFVNDGEMKELIELGAVGEIAGWAFDRTGTLLRGGTNERVAGIAPPQPATRPLVAVAGGRHKVGAIRAALRGELLTGLVTDESTAEAILQGG